MTNARIHRQHRSTSAAGRALAVVAALALGACATEPTGPDPLSSASFFATGSGSTSGGASGSGSQGGTVDPEACRGTLGAVTVEDVNVPAGATCVLEGTRVEGNVSVRTGARFGAIGASIDGDVQAEDALEVRTANGTFVGGNIQVKRRAVVRIDDTTVGGDVQLEESGASLRAARNSIGGNLQFKKAASATVSDTRIDGDLQFEENGGALSATGNEVRGNAQLFKNMGGVRLVENRVRQSLQCKENRPAPTGGGNVAGEKEEQCRRL